MKALLVSEFPHVFVPTEEWSWKWPVFEGLMNWFVWVSQASIVRLEAPERRSLKRYEFESVEMTRGGFGHVM